MSRDGASALQPDRARLFPKKRKVPKASQSRCPAPWPVDPAPWPVDPAPWPVDPVQDPLPGGRGFPQCKGLHCPSTSSFCPGAVSSHCGHPWRALGSCTSAEKENDRILKTVTSPTISKVYFLKLILHNIMQRAGNHTKFPVK